MSDFNSCHELWNCVKSNQRGKKLATLFYTCNWDPYFPINPTRLAKRTSKNDNIIDFLTIKLNVLIFQPFQRQWV